MDRARFIEHMQDIDQAMDALARTLTRYLEHNGQGFRKGEINGLLTALDLWMTTEANHRALDEQIEKCDQLQIAIEALKK